MKKIAWLIIAVLIIALVIGLLSFDFGKDGDKIREEIQESINEGNLEKSEVLAGQESEYLTFTQEKYEQALAENKIILLYFYASWCPICKVEQKETFAAFNELDSADVVGFRVDYKDGDTDSNEEALAKEFGVSYQHTKIIIKDGKQLLKAPDSWKKERYLSELNKVIT